MILPALYHWSPIDRRDSIRRGGLQPFNPPVSHSGELLAPYVSLGFTPSMAWGLSGDFVESGEWDDWDLWQVHVGDHDHIHVRSDFGPELIEVKVYTTIPPDRLWHVGSRQLPVFES